MIRRIMFAALGGFVGGVIYDGFLPTRTKDIPLGQWSMSQYEREVWIARGVGAAIGYWCAK